MCVCVFKECFSRQQICIAQRLPLHDILELRFGSVQCSSIHCQLGKCYFYTTVRFIFLSPLLCSSVSVKAWEVSKASANVLRLLMKLQNLRTKLALTPTLRKVHQLSDRIASWLLPGDTGIIFSWIDEIAKTDVPKGHFKKLVPT